MRIEANDYHAPMTTVFLDGRKIGFCTLADEEAGVVVVYETEMRDGYERAMVENGKLRKVTKRGRVEIYIRERS